MPSRFLLCAVAAVLLAVALTGCAPKGPEFVDEGRSYTTSSTVDAFAHADSSSLRDTSVDSAAKLRHDALASLRSDAGDAAAAADLITRVFPSGTKAVPVYIERARVDGNEALIVVEAIGRRGGKLADERLWVLDGNGDVLYSATR